LASTSPKDCARDLLGYCLRGEQWPAGLLNRLLDAEGADALISIVVERLADLFEPKLVDVYAALFSEVIAGVLPEFTADALLARYQRVRQPRAFAGDADAVTTVFVLSRVTLGADVAVTSVLLDAAKRRFPKARVVLVGSRKAWELFAGDTRVEHVAVTIVRSGSMRERLAGWFELPTLLSQPGSIVIDPDSRLTQLGLLPVCREENHYFFESRSFGGDGDEALPLLARRWAAATFGVEDCAPYIAPAAGPDIAERPLVSTSLGVGENPVKRIADPFESGLLAHLARRAGLLVIDKGAGGEEGERVERAVAQAGIAPDRVRIFQGSFADFASIIARSDLYAGYDSAGQHVAAACGVPLVSVFAGFASPRMFARWRPTGRGRIEVLRVENPAPADVLDHTKQAIDAIR
jgi:ADP-heptose:LPS heptosyltransferase